MRLFLLFFAFITLLSFSQCTSEVEKALPVVEQEEDTLYQRLDKKVTNEGNDAFRVRISSEDGTPVDTFASCITGSITPFKPAMKDKLSIKLVTVDSSRGIDPKHHVYDILFDEKGKLLTRWISVATYRLEVKYENDSLYIMDAFSAGITYSVDVRVIK